MRTTITFALLFSGCTCAGARTSIPEYRAPRALQAPTIDGVLVAPMIADGVETIIGSHRDPVFGPVVLFGLGGIFVEIVKQVSVRVAPIGVDEARRMIAEVPAASALLAGVRGRPPADIKALAEALARLSVYAAAHADSIESIDVNPLLVRAKGSGVVAADALVVARRD